MIGSITTGDHRSFPLMSLNPFAPAFLPHYQFSSNPPISLCISTAMSLPLAQIFFRLSHCLPPSITTSHARSLGQPTTDDTLVLRLIQPKKLSKQDVGALQPHPESSSLLPSPLQPQVQRLQAIHKTIQQFHQHLKAEQFNGMILQTIVLQPQNDFALLRYLHCSSIGTTPINDTSVNKTVSSPPTNPNPTSTALPIPCADEPSVGCSTPKTAVGPIGTKTNNSANADFQSPPNTREAAPTTRRTSLQEFPSLKNYLQMK